MTETTPTTNPFVAEGYGPLRIEIPAGSRLTGYKIRLDETALRPRKFIIRKGLALTTKSVLFTHWINSSVEVLMEFSPSETLLFTTRSEARVLIRGGHMQGSCRMELFIVPN